VTSKRGPTPPDSAPNGASEPESPLTLRSIEVSREVNLPEVESLPGPVYFEPQPLVAISDHKTIEVETIKLADDIDPRKLQTELRLARPSVRPPDSAQADVIVVSSQPPDEPRRRRRAPLVLLLLFGLLIALVFARGVAQRSRAAADAASAAAVTGSAVPGAALVAVPPSAAPVSAASAAPDASEAPAVEVAPPVRPSAAPPEPHAEKRNYPRHTASKPSTDNDPAINTSSPAAGASKPKRAIY
jgi:hypothetical protein